ncbi:MAG: hypothetical protein KJZ64_05270 [Sphingomonadaceae bacterium]|nr:hypothetical protein [Sphingomonadaceae bacterium]
MSNTIPLASITDSDVARFRAESEFDEQWYLSQYPDVRKSGIDPARHYLWLGKRLNRHPSKASYERSRGLGLHWCIITTPHVLFIAHTLSEQLKKFGWEVEIRLECPDVFNHDYYIVLCAQMFDKLPPGEKRIIYQLEQSTSSRWFSDRYFSDMNNSFAVLDYSLTNIEFLSKNGISFPHVYYLPIGASNNYADHSDRDKSIDILFYGDFKSCPRRQKMLEIAEERFVVTRIDSLFSNDIKELIQSSRVVLNIHYYEDAQLEMPRIQECLSLGVPVVSESTADQDDYAKLDGAVTFFECGNENAMISAISTVLADWQTSAGATQRAAAFWEDRFSFMFSRFLIGTGILPTDALDHIPALEVSEDATIALSLPETTDRRRMFDRETRQPAMQVFDGMRRRPGWIGCGMSYKYLCRSARAAGVTKLTILEDDALLNPDHFERLSIIESYLQENKGAWDVFSGVIAHLHDEARIVDVEHYRGMDFIWLDKMTSTVFNIYSDVSMDWIARWNQNDHHVESNAIDRYLENANLRVIVTDPFLVGHREELHSTLWGFQNTQYRDMIAESQSRLRTLKNEWLARNGRARLRL